MAGEYEYPVPKDLFPVLEKLGGLYGLWSLEKHLATLYQGESDFILLLLSFDTEFYKSCENPLNYSSYLLFCFAYC